MLNAPWSYYTLDVHISHIFCGIVIFNNILLPQLNPNIIELLIQKIYCYSSKRLKGRSDSN